MKIAMIPRVTTDDAKKARAAFEANEPRDLFYRAATELVELALRRATSLTLAEALAVLLQTWNKEYYRFHGKFDNAHFANIERVLESHNSPLAKFRDQSIADVTAQEQVCVTRLFQDFEEVLGPVGAAKALHLLAPKVFPLWDRAIAQAYKLALGPAGTNGSPYWKFIMISQQQSADLARADAECQNPLKLLDEYNYCKYTRKWL